MRKIQKKNLEIQENIDRLRESVRDREEFSVGVARLLKEKAKEIGDVNIQNFAEGVSDYVELECGKAELCEEEYSFASVIEDMVGAVETGDEKKPPEVVLDIDADIPRVLIGDRDKISRSITSLLKEVIGLTKDGFVSAIVRARREQYGVNLVMIIRATGLKMTSEELQKLSEGSFEPENYGDEDRRALGLDAALIRRRAALMNGLFAASSVQGGGCEFKIVIPQRIAEERPICELDERERYDVVCCLNLEKFRLADMRAAYVGWIENAGRKLGIRVELAAGIADCRRRLKQRGCSHLFITMYEYRQDREYFRQLAEQMPVIIVMDRWEKEYPGEEFIHLYKPVTILSVTAVLRMHSVRAKRRVESRVSSDMSGRGADAEGGGWQ